MQRGGGGKYLATEPYPLFDDGKPKKKRNVFRGKSKDAENEWAGNCY